MRTVWDSLAENSVLLHPPNITSNTLRGDSCRAESEWKCRLATESGRDLS